MKSNQLQRTLLKALAHNSEDCVIQPRNTSTSPRAEVTAKLHVLTLTPFYPCQRNEANGCFVAEPLRGLQCRGVSSSVIAVDSIYHVKRRETRLFQPIEFVIFGCPVIWACRPEANCWPPAFKEKSVRFIDSVQF